eukprot:358849-Chlamydomonas_euryale.AAC.2
MQVLVGAALHTPLTPQPHMHHLPPRFVAHRIVGALHARVCQVRSSWADSPQMPGVGLCLTHCVAGLFVCMQGGNGGARRCRSGQGHWRKQLQPAAGCNSVTRRWGLRTSQQEGRRAGKTCEDPGRVDTGQRAAEERTVTGILPVVGLPPYCRRPPPTDAVALSVTDAVALSVTDAVAVLSLSVFLFPPLSHRLFRTQ